MTTYGGPMPFYGNSGAFSPYDITAGKDPYERVGGDQGLQRWQHETLARNLGFGGDFGQGAHMSWLNADPTRMTAWNRGLTEARDNDPSTNFGSLDWLNQPISQGSQVTRGMNQAINKYLGYQGGFGGGGENSAWLQSNPALQQRYQGLTDVFGLAGSLQKNPLFGGGTGAFGGMGGGWGQTSMYPGMGGQMGGWGGMQPPQMQQPASNTYNNYYTQPMDFGFGSPFGGFGGFGGGFGGGFMPMDYGAPGGGWGGQNSAGSLQFKRGGRARKYAHGGRVGYAGGGPIGTGDLMAPWKREFMRVVGVDPASLGITDPIVAQEYVRARVSPDMQGRGAPLADPQHQMQDIQALGARPPMLASPQHQMQDIQMLGPRPQRRAIAPPRAFAPGADLPSMVPDPEAAGFNPNPPTVQPDPYEAALRVIDARDAGMAPPPRARTLIERIAAMLDLDKQAGTPAFGAWRGEATPPQAQQFSANGGRIRRADGGRAPGAFAGVNLAA